ncbi:MAG: hypothetical protein U9Q68_01985 [Euryarchaeota archaeon]|nr:hypothetical protein [Euryarchaeota archaeon]
MIAYLTKGIAYRDNGDIRVAGKSELNRIIAEKYEQKDFIGANEILGATRNISTEWTPFKLAERVSKSIRLSMSAYLKIIKYAANDKRSLSDSIIKILSAPMKQQLDAITCSSAAMNERIEPLCRLLDNWSTANKKQKNVITRRSGCETDLEEYRNHLRYSLDCNRCFDDRIYELLKKPVEYQFHTQCGETIPKEMIDRYVPYLSVDDVSVVNRISFNDEKNETTLSISATVIFGFEFEDYETFETEIIADFGAEAMEKFYNERCIGKGCAYCGFGAHFTFGYDFSGIISVDAENKVYIENINIDEQNRAISEAWIFKKITGKDYEDPTIYVDQVKDAIEKGDYDLATKINEVLAMDQTHKEISSWIYDILFDSTKSKVVTFIIPPVLIGLLELAKGGRKVSDLVDEYPEVA